MSTSSLQSNQPRHQSLSGPPTQETVRVAVLPPRLPTDVAPPTGLGPADAMGWDESLNWRHNETIDDGSNARRDSKVKGLLRKSGLTTKRKAAREDMPPFTFREVSYDVWRKHYAKDAQGRYHGTLAPAEDCLLLPEDVEKWSAGEKVFKGDQWTRGRHALPVYDQSEAEYEAAPAYQADPEPITPEVQRQMSAVSTGGTSNFTADGKTTEQIIQEAKDRAEAKKLEPRSKSWKHSIKRGTEFALMGAN